MKKDPAKASEVVERICELIREGVYPEVAAQSIGISARSYYEWRKEGEEDRLAGKETTMTEFLDAVNEAIAESEQQLVKIVIDGSKTDPRLALETLSRRFPYRWARLRDRIQAPQDLGATAAKPIAEMITEIAINASGASVKFSSSNAPTTPVASSGDGDEGISPE